MTKNIKQYIPIFVGSTYTDLIPHRKAVCDILTKLKLGVSGMEVFGARSEEPLDTCLSEVSKCQVFIGILGMRYGSIDEKTGKSFVQLEYETALKKLEDILIYLIDEEKAQITPKFVDVGESASKLRDFKELLHKKHTVETFRSPEDLCNKVERDLLRLFTEKGLVIEEEKLQPSVQPDETIQLLNKFDLMPDRFNGSEVELIIQFSGKAESLPANLSKAIGLRFGSSLRRKVKIIHPPEIPEQFSFLEYLNAEYSGCDFLYDAPKNKRFKVVAKLVFGQMDYITSEEKPWISTSLWDKPPKIKDLETGEVFEHYVKHSRVKAIVLVKQLAAS